jgi:hypothetical protein
VPVQGRPAHYFWTLGFTDLDRKTLLNARGNRVLLKVQRHVESALLELDLAIHMGKGLFFEPAPPLGPSGPWRKLAVVVGPGTIQAFWETATGEQSIVSAPTPGKVLDAAREVRLDPPDSAPDLGPRGALGLYVRRGSASFRQVMVLPLNVKN